MPKTRTSFKPGQISNPKGKPKGTKSAKVKAWEALGEYLTGAGAERFVKVMETSKDRDFILAYDRLLNYFKPKLLKGDHNIKGNQTIIIDLGGGSDNKG